jgi:ATP-dependent Lhr-like helicase
MLLKNAFREVAVIGGLVERHHPGKKKSGRQVSFSTDLIYDVLRRFEPEHLLLRAAWADARMRMTELGRLVRLVDRASATMVHVTTERLTPLAIPLMVIVGREALPPGAEADESLLVQAEALAQDAMSV